MAPSAASPQGWLGLPRCSESCRSARSTTSRRTLRSRSTSNRRSRRLLPGEAQPSISGGVNDRLFLNNSSIGIYPNIVELREELRRRGDRKWWPWRARHVPEARGVDVAGVVVRMALETTAKRGGRRSYSSAATNTPSRASVWARGQGWMVDNSSLISPRGCALASCRSCSCEPCWGAPNSRAHSASFRQRSYGLKHLTPGVFKSPSTARS